MKRLQRLLRGRRAVHRSRLCHAGLHPYLVEVRVHPADCDLGTCPGSHPAVQCPGCGATWDLLTGPDPRREALR